MAWFRTWNLGLFHRQWMERGDIVGAKNAKPLKQDLLLQLWEQVWTIIKDLLGARAHSNLMKAHTIHYLREQCISVTALNNLRAILWPVCMRKWSTLSSIGWTALGRSNNICEFLKWMAFPLWRCLQLLFGLTQRHFSQYYYIARCTVGPERQFVFY